MTIERRFHRTAPHRSLTFSGGVGELVRLNSVIVHVQCVIKLLLDNCICTLHFLWQKELLNAMKQKAFIGKKTVASPLPRPVDQVILLVAAHSPSQIEKFHGHKTQN